jgi:hypothetical protein
VLCISSGFSDAHGFSHPIGEPDVHNSISWNFTSSGLIQVGYDLNGNKKPDCFTLRVIISSFYSSGSKESIAKGFPGKHIFFVDYRKNSMFYIGMTYPIFYAFDYNEDGSFDLMFKDKLEDGVNGNEEYYDKPSSSSFGISKEVS